MEIRVAGIIPESFVDGVGIRFTIFMQGCLRNCKGCKKFWFECLVLYGLQT